MKLFTNGIFSTPANAAKWSTCANYVKQMGYTGVRVDAGLAEYAPTTSTYNTAGIDACIDACAFSDVSLMLILIPQPPNEGSWNTLQGTVVVSRRPNSTSWSKITEVMQHIIDHASNRWMNVHGKSAELLSFEYGNEPGWGGSGGPIGSLGYGTLDGATTGLQGSTNSKQDAANSSAVNLGYGTWDSDSTWDTMASYTGKAAYANVRGWHELSQNILPNLDFGQHTVYGPTSAGLDTNIEYTTYQPEGFTYHNLYDIATYNGYLGYVDSVQSATSYARAYKQLMESKLYSLKAHPANTGKPVAILEAGITKDTAYYSNQKPPADREHGRFVAKMLDELTSLDLYAVGHYRLMSDSDTEDEDIFSYSSVYSTGDAGYGVQMIARRNGVVLSTDEAFPGGGNWVANQYDT